MAQWKKEQYEEKANKGDESDDSFESVEHEPTKRLTQEETDP